MGTSRAKTSLTAGGVFPALIALLTMGLAGMGGGALPGSVGLTLLVLLGIGCTFAASKLLSCTLLRGVPSSFTLELPPFRRPQVAQVLVRSVLDRTLFVLGRAAAVAAPAGAVIWLLANVTVGGESVLGGMTRLLDPIARPFGLDGVLLTAFLLGLPANEIVLPIAVMAYAGAGTLAELGSLSGVRALLAENGWTAGTYLCAALFMLLHWPCSTTLLTVKKETGSRRWMLVAALLPTVFGLAACLAVNGVWRLIERLF